MKRGSSVALRLVGDDRPDLSAFGLELHEELGKGATGVVMRAVDLEAGDRPVAVKLISSTEPEVLDSLAREVDSVIKLRHPNIATLLRARTSSEPRFLVYELFRPAASSFPLSEKATADCGIKLCSGLAAAHAMGIVHSDIKPANMLWHDDQPLISDFGSARIEATTRFRLGFAFSPMWAAPWIREHGPMAADYASDVWSLAASLVAFNQSETPVARPAEDLRQTDLLSVLKTAMPDRPPSGLARPDEALVLGRRLQEYQQRRGWRMTPFPSEGQENWSSAPQARPTIHVGSPEPLDEATGGSTPSTGSRRRWWGVASAAVVILLGAGLASYLGLGPINLEGGGEGEAVEVSDTIAGVPADASSTAVPSDATVLAAAEDLEETTTEIPTADSGGTDSETPVPASVPEPDVALKTPLAFASDRKGNVDIYLLWPDGSVDEILTRSADDYSPSLSPDGDQIVFESNDGGTRAVYIAPVDGSAEPRQLSPEGSEATSPAWSPNGDRIAWDSRLRGNSDIVIHDLNTAVDTFVTTGTSDDRNPAWGPQGDALVFRSDRSGSGDIYSLDLSSQSLTQLTSSPWQEDNPSWGLGGLVAYEALLGEDTDVYVVPADGSSTPIRRTDRIGPDRSPVFDQGRLIIIEQHGLESSIVIEPGESQHVLDASTGFTTDLDIQPG